MPKNVVKKYFNIRKIQEISWDDYVKTLNPFLMMIKS